MMTRKDLIMIGLAAVVLLGGCFAENWRDARAGVHRERTRTWLAVVLALLLLGAGILGTQRARGRDLDGHYAASNRELKSWFDGLRSGKGPCCSDADGSAISDSDWESKDGHYRVRVPRSTIPGGNNDLVWVDVPDDAVITEPNRVGRTMVWPIYGYQGVTIRCFMPGSMT